MKDNVVQVNLCLTIGEMWSSRKMDGSQPSILRKNKKRKRKDNPKQKHWQLSVSDFLQ